MAWTLTRNHIIFLGILSILLLIYKEYDVIRYTINYIKLIIDGLVIDSTRREKDVALTAQLHWEHFQLQAQFMDKICESKGDRRNDFLWLTALVNDEYAVPAIVLGHSIRTLSCVRNMVVLASDEVSYPTREALQKVGVHPRKPRVVFFICSFLAKRKPL